MAKLLAVVLATAGALVALPAGAAPAEQGTFSGTVLLPDGTPADGIAVELVDADEWYTPPRATTTTGPDGTYEVDAAAGGYLIRFIDPSGDHLWSLHQGSAGAYNEFYSAPRTVLAGGETVTVDHTLVRSGSVRGTITLPADVDPADVSVVAHHPRPAMGMAPRTPAQWGRLAADGTYVIPLREGDYVVDVTHSGDLFDDLSLPVRVNGTAITTTDVAPRRTGSISGVVRATAGSADENVRVTAHFSTSDDSWSEAKSVVVKAGEPYRLGGLGTGAYRVEFAPEGESALMPSYWLAVSSIEQATDVFVTKGEDTAGIDGELAADSSPSPSPSPSPTPTPEPEPTLKEIKRLKAPKVTGKTKVGRTLKASKGTWKPKRVKVKFRWYAKKGKKAVAVKAGKKSKLKLKKSMKGKWYRVVVTVSKKGYKTVKFRSKWSKKVRK